MSNLSQFLIASDLDGTFFGKNTAVLPNNIEAIHEFERAGGIFTIATGRGFPVLSYVLPETKQLLSGPAIVSGGACLYNFQDQKILDLRALNKEKTIKLIAEIKKAFPHIGYRICTDYGFLTDHFSDLVAENLRRFQEIVTVDDVERHLSSVWFKITYVSSPEEKQELDAFLQSFHRDFYVTKSSPRLTEIFDPSASKGKQIDNLRKIYPNKTIICVGDYDNDIDMLQAADIAACPANAQDAVKNISSLFLCDHKEGCIADLISKLKKMN